MELIQIHACVFEVTDGDDKDQVSVYYSCEDFGTLCGSDIFIKGVMSCHDLVTNFCLKNPYNFSDEFFICAKSTFLQGSITTGLLSALSQSLRNPYATKVIFSLTPLEQNEKLKEWLRIADKESYSEIKRTNSLVVY